MSCNFSSDRNWNRNWSWDRNRDRDWDRDWDDDEEDVLGESERERARFCNRERDCCRRRRMNCEDFHFCRSCPSSWR